MHGLRVFSDLCVGCPCCMIACKAEKSIREMDVNPLEIEKKIIDSSNDEPVLSFIIHTCKQCEDAPCIEACPANGALYKNDKGTVIVKEELCLGAECKKCIEVCPYDAIKLDSINDSVVKCDLCFDRVELAQQPACVSACPAKVIYVGEIDEIETQIKQRRAHINNRRTINKEEAEKKWTESGIDVQYFDI